MAEDKVQYYYDLLKPTLAALREKGITVSPETHVTVIAVLKGFQHEINDLNDLLAHILPVLAKNTAEQNIVRNEFKRQIAHSDNKDAFVTGHKQVQLPPVLPETPAPRTPIYKNPLYYFILLIVAIITLNVVAYQQRQVHKAVVSGNATTDEILATDSVNKTTATTPEPVHITAQPAVANTTDTSHSDTTSTATAATGHPADKNLSPVYAVIEVLLHPLFLALMACIPGYLYLRSLRLKKIREKKLRLKQIIYSLQGSQGPVEVIFDDANRLIEDELDLLLLNRLYHSKVESEHLALDIPRSINATIRAEGFLQMEWKNLEKDQELLVITDKNNVAYDELVNYLLSRFDKNDHVEKFYFTKEDGVFENNKYPHGIDLPGLHRLYADRILLVFSDGYRFFNKWQPTVNKGLTAQLLRWKTNAIITPVPLPDWKAKEQSLSELTSFVPADLKDLQLLFSRLGKQEKITPGRKGPGQAYSLEPYMFTNVDDLARYLNNEFLFQWLCALAVFPRLDWNITIEIGHALKQEHFGNGRINYTALLKLIRIGWMNDKIMPDELRLALLKELEPQHEKTVRLAVIRMLDEATMRPAPGVLAYEEMLLQLMSNKFIMYSQDPERYARYKKDFEDYKLLLDEKKITDAPLMQYLAKDGGKGKWSTLMCNKNLSAEAKDSLPFVETLTTSPEKWLKKSQSIILCLVIFMGGYLILRNYIDEHILGMAFFFWSLLLIPILRNDDEKEPGVPGLG